MELHLTVTEDTARLSGTVRAQDGDATWDFFGALELLACIERLTTQDTVPTSTQDN
jgi:hypothetical protein